MEMVDFLGFDVSNFTKAAKQVKGAYDGVTGAITKTAGKVGPSVSAPIQAMKGKAESALGSLKGGLSGMSGMAMKVAGPIAGIAAGFFAVKTAYENMPEIGQTFKIAGEIIMKNFFWPIRQFILPYLQKVLDWVAKNRTMFASWGASVANIMRVVFLAGKLIFTLISSIVEPIIKKITSILGLTGQSVEGVINLIALKLSVILAFIEPYLKSIGGFIGEVVAKVMDLYTAFKKAFIESGVMDNVKELWDSIKNLVKEFVGLDGMLPGLGEALRGFASILGGTVGAAVIGIASNIKFAIDMLVALKNMDASAAAKAVENWNAAGNKMFDAIAKPVKEMITGGKAVEGEGQPAGAPNPSAGAVRPVTPVHDAILRPDGTIVKTDPDDTLVAMKRPGQSMRGAAGGGVNIGSIVGALTVYVTEGNARKAGENFAEGLGEKIRMILQHEMHLVGDL